MECKLDLKDVLSDLNTWKVTNDQRDAITKEFQFSDFKSAFSFMTKVALKAEDIGHHPEWFNVYKTVEVTLKTHDVNSLSDLDKKLSEKMDFFLLNN